jgi:beta-glucosidase
MEGSGTAQFGEPFKSRYIDLPNEPLFPFGYGLSYSSFEYRDLQIETPIVSSSGMLIVTAVLKNSGERTATEVVQLYVRDLVGSVTRPVKELRGFQRMTLEPGAEQTVRFEVPVEGLGFWGIDMRYAVEPGIFKVWIGASSIEGLEGEFEVRNM